MRGFVFGVLFAVVAFAAAAYLLLEHGYVDFRADQTPSPVESRLAMHAVDTWTDRHAGDDKSPLAATDENITAGATLYVNHCAGCHGVPSNPVSQFQRSFYPPAPGFFREMPDMEDGETFYVIQHGIRWTGMPAWNHTLSDEQIWQIVIFFDNMHKLPPAGQQVFETPAQGGTTAK